MRPFLKWLEVIPALDEMKARFENDDPNMFLLNEVKIGKSKSNNDITNDKFITDPFILSDPNTPDKIIYKSIPEASVLYNKDHIESKANTRFPTDPDIATYVMSENVSNYNEHIMFIFDKVYNRHKNDIAADISNWVSGLGLPIPEINSYPQTKDVSFKYSIYTEVKYKDKNNDMDKYRNLQIEAALAVTLTLLTFNQVPLANIPWDQWYKNIPNDTVLSKDNSAALDIIKRLNKYNEERGYDMIPLEIFNPDRVRFIPRLDVVNKPVLYIAGYTTWVKEVDQNGNLIRGEFNKFNRQCGTPDMDVYCTHNGISAKTYHDVFKDFGKKNEISDSIYEKLKLFEIQREKNTSK